MLTRWSNISVCFVEMDQKRVYVFLTPIEFGRFSQLVDEFLYSLS